MTATVTDPKWVIDYMKRYANFRFIFWAPKRTDITCWKFLHATRQVYFKFECGDWNLWFFSRGDDMQLYQKLWREAQ